jgi:hypothetical protein
VCQHTAVLALLLASSAVTLAQKPQPLVVGHWTNLPKSASLHKTVDVTLRITAAEDVSNAEIRLLPSPGIKVVGGPLLWKGPLKKEQDTLRRYKIQVVSTGESTLGASITNRRTDDVQVSGALLRIHARNGTATLRDDTPAHDEHTTVKK